LRPQRDILAAWYMRSPSCHALPGFLMFHAPLDVGRHGRWRHPAVLSDLLTKSGPTCCVGRRLSFASNVAIPCPLTLRSLALISGRHGIPIVPSATVSKFLALFPVIRRSPPLSRPFLSSPFGHTSSRYTSCHFDASHSALRSQEYGMRCCSMKTCNHPLSFPVTISVEPSSVPAIDRFLSSFPYLLCFPAMVDSLAVPASLGYPLLISQPSDVSD